MEKYVKKIARLKLTSIDNYLDTLDISTVKNIKEYLDDLYYNTGESTLPDEKYDSIKDYISREEPGSVKVGAKLRQGDNKITLPLWLGSMDKIKPSDISSLTKWTSKYPPKKEADNYLLTEKLDGVSGLLRVKNGEYISLYTRGDGEVGSDISYLLKYMTSLPNKIKEKGDLYIRGELIIQKAIFEKKYSKQFANPRNMVSGLVNAKTLRTGVSDIHFVSYEIIELSEYLQESPDISLSKLGKMGFEIPMNRLVEDIDIEILTETLIEFKKESLYEIDGMIVQSNQKYTRNDSGNPDYAFAFKINFAENEKQTIVKKVSWNISKSGMLKPRVEINPVSLSGVTVTFTTGFNGKYIEDNSIGPGAVITITRSGDVIPYITGVVKPAKKAEMPDIPYYWNKSRVDIYAKDAGPMLCIKIISHFMTTLGIKQVAISTIEKLYSNGFDNLYKILTAEPDDFIDIEGIQEKSANRIYNNIHEKLDNVPVYKLMAATGIFGLGVGIKKLKELMANIPDLLKLYSKISKDDLIDKINNVEGFSDITTEKVYTGIPHFNKFLYKYRDIITVKSMKTAPGKVYGKEKSIDLTGKKYVFSGFRDKELEETLENMGANVTTSVSKNTTAVIVKNLSESTGKIQKAKSLRIPVILVSDFKDKMSIN